MEDQKDGGVFHCKKCGDIAVAQYETGICKVNSPDCGLGLSKNKNLRDTTRDKPSTWEK